jgi:thiamine biosynthesis lipoprotein
MVEAAVQPERSTLPGLAGVRPARVVEVTELELTAPAMGGELRLRVAPPAGAEARAERDLRLVAARVEAWAGRLTRFSQTSDLSVLNANPAAGRARLRPTIAEVLAQAARLSVRTEGSLDVALLDERLTAENGRTWASAPLRPWRLEGRGRVRTLVRDGRILFDLDGVAKGWIADRALHLLRAYPDVLVDADGDVAMRTSLKVGWVVAISDPFDDASELAALRVPEGKAGVALGVSTSGTSVHRWHGPDGPRHHIIDPRTGRSAGTDVAQATVVAESALVAEALAKSAVIRGSEDGLDLLERSGAWAAVLLLENGEVRATPATSQWLT